MPDIRAEIDSMLGEVKEEETVEEEASNETVEEETVDEPESETDEESEEGSEEEPEEEVSISKDEEQEEVEVEKETKEETVEEETSEPETEEPPDDLVAMREQMNLMSDTLLQKGIPIPGIDVEPDPVVAPVVGQTPIVPATQQMNLEDLVVLEEGSNFDEIMESPEKFVSFQRNLLQRYGQMLEQQFTRAIPNIVQNQVKQVTALNKAVDKFYTENNDLEVVRPTVGAIADRIVAVHPDWSLDKVMAEAAVTTRKVLRMPGKAEVKKSKVLKPSFAKPKGSKKRIPQPKVSKLQSEIDDLL
jgi:flagellar biosynthesis GTPase FlhF